MGMLQILRMGLFGDNNWDSDSVFDVFVMKDTAATIAQRKHVSWGMTQAHTVNITNCSWLNAQQTRAHWHFVKASGQNGPLNNGEYKSQRFCYRRRKGP